jgi:hypothetical protein
VTRENQRAFVARVTRVGVESTAGNGVVFYAVLADTRGSALAAVQEVVSPGDHVEITDGRLSPDTARALDLQPGQAKAMDHRRSGPMVGRVGCFCERDRKDLPDPVAHLV